MTGPPAWTQGPQRLFGTAERPPHSNGRSTRQRRPSRAAERSSMVVDVEEPSRLLECAQVERQLRFQHLVRHYMSQILHGCVSAYCTTPTCLSCNKRVVSRPFRPPTQLTARALAFYLASQDHPRCGLCPHQLRVDPASFEIDGAVGVSIRDTNGGAERICDVFPRPRPHATISAFRGAYPPSYADPAPKPCEGAARVMDAVARRHQARKDPKSLGQNLFDTITMIFSYSKQIPSSLSVFTTLHSPSARVQENSDIGMAQDKPALPDSRTGDESLDVTFTTRANGHAVPHSVNGSRTPAEHMHHGSPRTHRRLSKSHLMHITSEVLSNGQHIHKIRHLPDLTGNSHSPHKLFDHYPLDGTVETPDTEGSRMRAKARVMDLPIRLKRPWKTDSPSEDNDTPTETPAADRRPILPVASHLTCDIMDRLKEGVYHHRREQSADFNFVVDYDSNRNFRPAKPFVNRSMFYTLSDPEALLKSFRDQTTEAYENTPLPHLDAHRLTHSFRDWNRTNGALVFDSLWVAVEALFRVPPELDTQKSPHLKPSRKDASPQQCPQPPYSPKPLTPRYLTNEEAAHIIMICIHALTSLVPNGWPHTWVQVRNFRSWGVIIPGAPRQADFTDGFVHPWLSIVDALEYEPAIRLADRLLRGIGARICFENVLAGLKGQRYCGTAELPRILVEHLAEVEQDAIRRKSKMKANQNTLDDPGWTVTATFTEWLKTIIIKQWDGKAEINKWSSVGTAIMLLGTLHTSMKSLNLRADMFYIPYFNERLDIVQDPLDFLTWEPRPNTLHLLQYHILFPPEYVVGYFRTINFTTMFQQFEGSARASSLASRVDFILRNEFSHMVRSQLRVLLSDYFVLEISRQDPLKETLDQLWGQEKRMLLKPLKVRMGMDEGEVGLDQGGVTYEFFGLVLGEAFNPDNGMFTFDSETRMVWFQPASLEPAWKYEMLGILFSLAVYNGITLPVTFPMVFYKHLLDPYPQINISSTDSIRDGWPQLARSFDELLSYDGDVADVYMRDYTFSFHAFGRNIDVDILAFKDRPWPARNDVNGQRQTSVQCLSLDDEGWRHPEDHSDSDTGPEVVTSENRKEFVEDYILWLTYHSVKPQLLAFVRGFYTCLDPKSLRLFTPPTLRALIEGNPSISIPLLRKATHYEGGYSATHPTIIDFWSIVEDYGEEDKKALLEFVTASERVPVTGFKSIQFGIVRSGEDTEMLPTSSTCFGKLMLPEYKGKEKLERKLGLALRNCKGFGVV